MIFAQWTVYPFDVSRINCSICIVYDSEIFCNTLYKSCLNKKQQKFNHNIWTDKIDMYVNSLYVFHPNGDADDANSQTLGSLNLICSPVYYQCLFIV